MGADDLPIYGRTSLRTIFLAVLGFGAAAMAASYAVVSGSGEPLAVLGTTAVLGLCAIVIGVCAAFLPTRAEHVVWSLAAAGAFLMTVASYCDSVRCFADAAGSSVNAHLLNSAGLLVLAVSAAWWPWAHRHDRSLVLPFGAALGGIVFFGFGFWPTAGSALIEASYRSTSVSPFRLRELMLVLTVTAAVGLFSVGSAVFLRQRSGAMSHLIMALGVLAIVASNVYWLWMLVLDGRMAGSMADFARASGHVLIAVGASLAVDAYNITS